MIVFDAPSDHDRDVFCFGGRFPSTTDGIRELIFNKTGYSNSGDPLGVRGWHLLNRSLNEGMKLDLDDETLRTLSLMDDALSHVKRFAGMSHMHEIAADSTAAHSHQVMRTIEEVVRKTFPTHVPPAINAFRKEAILGAWVHDMGELVTELATATDMFNMDANERTALSQAKDAFEHEMLAFALDLAAYCLEQKNPEMFAQEIIKLRDAIQSKTETLDKIATLRGAITARREQLGGLPRSDTGTRLWDIYERTESPSEHNFLHPFVKTLECVEGQRYLQRNAKPLRHTEMALATSHEIVEGVRRCERRLPLMMQEGETVEVDGNVCSAFYKLAQQAAHYTYGSIARQFAPGKGEEYVSVAPPYIDRAPDPRKEPFTDEIVADNRHKVRARWHSILEDEHKKHEADAPNGPIWTSAEAGGVYRAAQALVLQAHPRWQPTTASLLSLKDTPHLPEEILHQLKRVELVPAAQPQHGRAA